MSQEIDEEKINEYLKRNENALKIIEIRVPENSHLYDIAMDFRRMAQDYTDDARYFYGKGDFINAFASLSYAYGWIDAGARLGLFDVGNDHVRFTLKR
ncbi:MAG: DUF357 domain-containing protein [Thermoplasmata archaeon]|mgnify:CR=1 FL=1